MSAGRDLRDEAAEALRQAWASGSPFLPGGTVDMHAFADAVLAAVEPRIRAEVLAEVALEIRSASSIDINARAAISAVLSGRARRLDRGGRRP